MRFFSATLAVAAIVSTSTFGGCKGCDKNKTEKQEEKNTPVPAPGPGPAPGPAPGPNGKTIRTPTKPTPAGSRPNAPYLNIDMSKVTDFSKTKLVGQKITEIAEDIYKVAQALESKLTCEDGIASYPELVGEVQKFILGTKKWAFVHALMEFGEDREIFATERAAKEARSMLDKYVELMNKILPEVTKLEASLKTDEGREDFEAGCTPLKKDVKDLSALLKRHWEIVRDVENGVVLQNEEAIEFNKIEEEYQALLKTNPASNHQQLAQDRADKIKQMKKDIAAKHGKTRGGSSSKIDSKDGLNQLKKVDLTMPQNNDVGSKKVSPHLADLVANKNKLKVGKVLVDGKWVDE
jgi:hypothetical protein